MNFDRQKKLVQKLVDKTAAGEVEWKAAVRENSYQLSFDDYSLRINLIQRGEAPDYEIEMINSEALVVDTFNDEELDRHDTNHSWYSKMRDLYDSARRQALGADEALDAILNRLDGIPF